MLPADLISHNRFPPDTAFPQIDILSDGFEELCLILVKHNAQKNFRLRLLHRHTMIPDGQILLGSSIANPTGFWTRPTPIVDIDPNNIYPYILSLDFSCDAKGFKKDVLLPSEFREGPPVNIEHIASEFFTEFINCLRARGLGNTIGLEVIRAEPGKMIELNFDTGSLLLAEAEVMAEARGKLLYRETGWAVAIKDGAVEKDGETRCIVYPTGHVKATKVQVESLEDALEILREEGVIN